MARKSFETLMANFMTSFHFMSVEVSGTYLVILSADSTRKDSLGPSVFWKTVEGAFVGAVPK